jgi:hypothetical protein
VAVLAAQNLTAAIGLFAALLLVGAFAAYLIRTETRAVALD